jgi:histidine triad (HIT) family protein
MRDCIFCKIIDSRSESDVTVYENDSVVGLISLHQKAANFGHVLVLPKAHIETIYTLPAALDVPIMSALRVLSRAVKMAFLAEGIHIRQNNESAADQDVFHLHFHIVPRFREDAFDDRPYQRLPIELRKSLAVRLTKEILAAP